MLKSGNSTTDNCMKNLLLLRRGEVQIDYMRGLHAEIFDRPSVSALSDLMNDVLNLRAIYEPRSDDNEQSMTPTDPEKGNFHLNISIQ